MQKKIGKESDIMKDFEQEQSRDGVFNLYISMPMRNLSSEEVRNKQKGYAEVIKEYIANEHNKSPNDIQINILNLASEKPQNREAALTMLGNSLAKMSSADIILFTPGWSSANGCKMEHDICMQYLMDSPVQVLNMEDCFMKPADLKHKLFIADSIGKKASIFICLPILLADKSDTFKLKTLYDCCKNVITEWLLDNLEDDNNDADGDPETHYVLIRDCLYDIKNIEIMEFPEEIVENIKSEKVLDGKIALHYVTEYLSKYLDKADFYFYEPIYGKEIDKDLLRSVIRASFPKLDSSRVNARIEYFGALNSRVYDSVYEYMHYSPDDYHALVYGTHGAFADSWVRDRIQRRIYNDYMQKASIPPRYVII